MLVHDVSHPGMSNVILKVKSPELTMRFGLDSTAEKLHVHVTKTLLKDPALDFLCDFSPRDRQTLMHDLEELVLATDIARHKELLSACLEQRADLDMAAMILAVKLADLSHNLRPYGVHKKWVSRLQEELEIQGLSLGENDHSLAQNQVSFLTTFVRPLLSQVQSTYGHCEFLHKVQHNLEDNIFQWGALKAAMEKQRLKS